MVMDYKLKIDYFVKYNHNNIFHYLFYESIASYKIINRNNDNLIILYNICRYIVDNKMTKRGQICHVTRSEYETKSVSSGGWCSG